MNVVLPKEPQLLRNSFSSVRQRLGGNLYYAQAQPVEHELAKHESVTIFDGAIRSELQKDGKIRFDALRGLAGQVRHRHTGEMAREVAVKKEKEAEYVATTKAAAALYRESLQNRESLQTNLQTSIRAAVTAERTKEPLQAPRVHLNRHATKAAATAKPAWKKVTGLMLSVMTATSIIIAAFIFIPALYYTVFPADVIEIDSLEQGTPLGGSFDKKEEIEVVEKTPYVPPVDPNLPDGSWIIIPKIGVHTQLRATADPNVALAEGVWHVPDFGMPGDRDLPMIVAAHRYGWKWWWKDDYWKYHSFYLLPDTQPGDRIEVIADKRKWVYEIYAGEEGEEIRDYDADLILYTCKFLKGPVRHFRYARLIDPTADSQKASTTELGRLVSDVN